MDTRFWGPDGWKLLHSITVGYPDKPSEIEKETYRLFFNCLKHVLPCIYCRRSYTGYIGELPVEGYLDNKKKLVEWLYLIHNRVNDKLRKQGLNPYDDPSLKEIHSRYTNFVSEINAANCINMPGWDFLYCVLFNYPEHKNEIETERQINYVIFFNYLPKVLPFPKVKKLLENYLEKNPFVKHNSTRDSITKWGYNFERLVSKAISCNCAPYDKIENHIELYRAGCGGKKDVKPTCRLGNSPNAKK
jgi:hypothetical protein